MSTFYVQQSALKARATEIKKIRANDEQIMQRLRGNIMGLSEIWKGSAQDALVTKFQENQKIISEFLLMVEEYANVMDLTVTKSDESDKALKAKVRGI